MELPARIDGITLIALKGTGNSFDLFAEAEHPVTGEALLLNVHLRGEVLGPLTAPDITRRLELAATATK